MSIPLPTHGLHDNIPEQAYHQDPDSLSSTGAKTLLYEGPSVYQWRREHPVHKDVFDFGSVSHALILGAGDYRVLDFDSWRSKAAQEARDQARADGATPILAKDHETAQAVADAVHRNPQAARLLAEGRPEVSGWATDPETGVVMRGRFDWLRTDAIVDVKTSGKPVHPTEFQWTARNHHYWFQAAWYQRLHHLCTGERVPFLWVAVTTTAPHDCYVLEADQAVIDDMQEEVDRALRLYADCTGMGAWPSLWPADQIHTITDPRRAA